MRVTIEQLHQHVFELWGREDGIRWDTNGFGGKADLVTGTIRIPPIRSEAAYAVALHEIGHIRCQHLDKGAVGAEEVACEILACERRAWELDFGASLLLRVSTFTVGGYAAERNFWSNGVENKAGQQ